MIENELNNFFQPQEETIINMAEKANTSGLKDAFFTRAENMIKEQAIKKMHVEKQVTKRKIVRTYRNVTYAKKKDIMRNRSDVPSTDR